VKGDRRAEKKRGGRPGFTFQKSKKKIAEGKNAHQITLARSGGDRKNIPGDEERWAGTNKEKEEGEVGIELVRDEKGSPKKDEADLGQAGSRECATSPRASKRRRENAEQGTSPQEKEKSSHIRGDFFRARRGKGTLIKSQGKLSRREEEDWPVQNIIGEEDSKEGSIC